MLRKKKSKDIKIKLLGYYSRKNNTISFFFFFNKRVFSLAIGCTYLEEKKRFKKMFDHLWEGVASSRTIYSFSKLLAKNEYDFKFALEIEVPDFFISPRNVYKLFHHSHKEYEYLVAQIINELSESEVSKEGVFKIEDKDL